MPKYNIAYGVNARALKSRNLIDAFIAASIRNDEKTMARILESIIPTKPAKTAPTAVETKQTPKATETKPAPKAAAKKEPFAHLKEGN